MLVAARILQGVGGALLTPGSLAIIQASFRQVGPRRGGRARGRVCCGVAGAIGPFVGGGLVDGPGWRWAFLLNLPVAALTIVLTRAAVPETRDAHPTRDFDVTGVVLAVAGLAAGDVGAHRGRAARLGRRAGGRRRRGRRCRRWSAFVAHILRAETRWYRRELFRIRTFTVINVMTVQLYAAIGVAFFLVAYELQVAAGWSAPSAGAALLPTTILMLLLSARSGALGQRIGPRLQLIVARCSPARACCCSCASAPIRLGERRAAGLDGVRARAGDLRRAAHGDGDGAGDPDTSASPPASTTPWPAPPASARSIIPVVAGLSVRVGAAEVTTLVPRRNGDRRGAGRQRVTAGDVRPRTQRAGNADRRKVHCQFDGPPLQADPELCPMSQSE